MQIRQTKTRVDLPSRLANPHEDRLEDDSKDLTTRILLYESWGSFSRAIETALKLSNLSAKGLSPKICEWLMWSYVQLGKLTS